MLKQEETSRRDFIKTMGCMCGLAAVTTSLSACDALDKGTETTSETGIVVSTSNVVIDLTKKDTQALAPAGGFLFIQQARVIVINNAGTIRAFSSVCPHAAQPVNTFDGTKMTCSAHGSQFSPNGGVIKGPAASGLSALPSNKVGNVVTISLA